MDDKFIYSLTQPKSSATDKPFLKNHAA